MRALKVRSCGIRQQARPPETQLYGTRPSLNDRASTFACIYIYIYIYIYICNTLRGRFKANFVLQ